MMGMLPHSGLLVYISGQMLETTAPVVERRLYAAVLRKASATDGAAVSTVGTCTRHLPEALSPSQMASAQWASCADERWGQPMKASLGRAPGFFHITG